MAKKRINYSDTVDELAALNSEIEPLLKKKEELETILKASGKSEIMGTLFRAVISDCTRSGYKAELLRKYVPEKTLAKCKYSTDYVRLSLYDK